MIAVEVVPADGNRAEIAALWGELERACKPRYFLTWSWIETWLDTLRAHERPQLVVVRRAGLAIAAFFVRVTPTVQLGVLRWQRAHFNETGTEADELLSIEYNAWLYRPGAIVDLVSVLDRLPLTWDELVMRRLDPDVPLGLDGIYGRYRVVEIAREPSPQVDLAEVRTAKDGYLSLLGRSTRAAIRRSRREYEERGPLTLERATTDDQALGFLHELGGLSQQRFAEKGGGSFASSYFRRFHETLISRRLASGEAELLRLRCGEQTICLGYYLVHEGIVSFYQSGIRYEEDNRLKPGLLLHAEAITHFAARGAKLYDFLGGHARYKSELATRAVELRSVRVLRQRPVFYVEEGLRALGGWARALRKRASS